MNSDEIVVYLAFLIAIAIMILSAKSAFKQRKGAKVCPYCQCEIPFRASKCPYCGSSQY